jgi:hypothetical protein
MFIPRHPVIENQFCQLAAGSGHDGAGNVIAYAGSACYLDNTQTDSTVKIYAANESDVCFGFLMQKVKQGYHAIHPAGMTLPGDLGSSDVIAQPSYNATTGVIDGYKPAPVGVAHLGIWDTIHYWNNSLVLNAGDTLGIRQSSLSELTKDGTLNGAAANQSVAKVVKGASAAQVAANDANTTLYPIRIKLLY